MKTLLTLIARSHSNRRIRVPSLRPHLSRASTSAKNGYLASARADIAAAAEAAPPAFRGGLLARAADVAGLVWQRRDCTVTVS